MAERTTQQTIMFVLKLLGLMGASLGAGVWGDLILQRLWKSELPRLISYQKVPLLQLGDSFSGPARLQAALHSTEPKETPSSQPSAIWYAWVTETRKSGKNTYTTTVCSKGDDEGLLLRDSLRTVPLRLPIDDDHVHLLKSTTLESVAWTRVALDFGKPSSTRDIPERMRNLCPGLEHYSGTLHYYEASLQPGTQVTVVACKREGQLRSCSDGNAAISIDGLRPVFRGYANHAMDPLRGVTMLCALFFALLATLLYSQHSDPAEPK